MRLTLRTLLAYMDNMLEPADAEVLRAKIEESEFAKILMARIEAAIRQPRLASLPLDEKGLGLDANSIAQYLDNTLSPELVPELEQFLLQSDMQLAEVAACHQVLATILDIEPVVSPELKHRVRCLGSPKEIAQGPSPSPTKRTDYGTTYENSVTSSSLQNSSSSGVSITKPAPTTPPVPVGASMSDSLVMTDPLRPAQVDWTQAADSDSPSSKSRRGLRVLVTLALAILLVLATLQAIGPTNRLWNLWTATADATATVDEDDAANAQANTQTSNTNDDDPSTPPSDNPAGDSENAKANASSANDTDAASQNNLAAGNDLSNNSEADMQGSTPDPAANPNTNPPSNNNETTANSNNPSENDLSENDASRPIPKPNLPLVNVQVASWTSPSDVAQNHLLFAKDETNNQLVRITSSTTFAHNSRLLLAPAVRSSIVTNHDVVWNFYSAADIRVTTDSQVPWLTTVELRQGKAVLQDTGKNDLLVRPPQTLIRNGNTLIALRWSEMNSAVAVEATPQWIDPTLFDPQYVGPLVAVTDLRFSVLQGKVEFSSVELTDSPDISKFVAADGARQKMTLGDCFIRSGSNQWDATKIETTPAWIETPLERPIDRQAASDLMQILPAGARANLVVVETLQNRRAEIAALAAQTLILSDDFSFLAGPTGMLNDERFRSHWTTLIDAVRERASSSPESLETLKSSLAAQDVQRGALLFQILIGYSTPELKLSAAERLVNLLESEYLDERILAIYQLKRITGKDLGFQPDRPSRGLIQDWKRLFRTGGIPPK